MPTACILSIMASGLEDISKAGENCTQFIPISSKWHSGRGCVTFVVTDVDTDELYKITKLTIELMYKSNLKKVSV